MINYILNFILCSGSLWLVYRLFLANEHMHTFNRFYLLCSIVFSLAVPLVTIHLSQNEAPAAEEQHLNIKNAPNVVTPMAPAIIIPAEAKVEVASRADTAVVQSTYNWAQILLVAYFLVVAFLLARLIRNLYLVKRVISGSKLVAVDSVQLVLLEDDIAPHSFLNYIFISQNEYTAGKIQPEIICHEQTHVRQLHSLDVIFIELVQVICWFNPFLTLYRRSIQLNHEFLADEAVISNYKDAPAYQYLLLNKMVGANRLALTSEFVSYLTIKRRLLMMAKSTTRAEAWVLWLTLVPIIATAFILFCNKTHAAVIKADDKLKPAAIRFPQINYTPEQVSAMDDEHKAEVAYQQTYDALVKRNLAEEVWNKEITIRIAAKCEGENGRTIGTIANYGRNQLLIEAANGDEETLSGLLKPGDEVKMKVLGASYFYRKDRPLEVTPDYIEKGDEKIFDRRDSLQKPTGRHTPDVVKFPKPVILLYDSAKSKNNPTVVTWWNIKTKVIPPAPVDAPQSVLDDYKDLLEKYHLPPVRKNGILALPAEIYTPDHLKLQGLYDSMSKSQQDAQQVRFSNLILPSDKHIPTAKQLTAWQDMSNYRVWIDGKKIDQADLKNYKAADFDLYYLYALSKTTNPNYKNYHYEVKLMTPTYYADYYKKTSERKIRSLFFPGAWK